MSWDEFIVEFLQAAVDWSWGRDDLTFEQRRTLMFFAWFGPGLAARMRGQS